MAFFSNSKQSHSQLRRNRSTSSTRDPKSTEETSFHKRSLIVSPSPSASATTPDSHDTASPFPTSVTAGFGFCSRTAGTSNVSLSLYDHSSTPIPFTKPSKRASPPPFSNLMIDVPRPPSVEAEQPSSPHAAVRSEKRLKSSSRTASSSPSALFSIYNSSPVRHASLSPGDFYSGLISPSMPQVERQVERQQSPFPRPIAAVLPLKPLHSPTHAPNSDIEPIALPTPVSSPEGRKTMPESMPSSASPPGRLHSRSRSATNSPASYVHGSGPASPRSSAGRFPLPMADVGEASCPGSASPSGKSTPSHEAAPGKPREKGQCNVLRKRSITHGNRRREPESAPTSDAEKKNNALRPRSRSVVLPRRRDSSGLKLDVSQPLPAIPVTSADLTPAKEILVSYKESHRDSFSPDLPLRHPGKMVVIGSGEDSNANSLESPRSPGLKSGRKDEEKRNPSERGAVGVKGLKRKLSGKWSGKEPSRRRDEPIRSASESAADASSRRRDLEANRSATLSNDTGSGSPAINHSLGRERLRDHDGGRVWEVDVGKWSGNEEKDISNSRRLWNLVKRLSSGNLKDKASPPSEPPPPVPPLPKDASRKQDTSPSEGLDFHAFEMTIPRSAVLESPGRIKRFISTVPPLLIPRSEGASVSRDKQTNVIQHRSEIDSGGGVSPMHLRVNAIQRSGITGTAIQIGRTATTRSSSPSSETTKFFSRSRSSSSSSYGDVIAPPLPSIPSTHAGKYSPSPQHHNNSSDRREYGIAMDHDPSALASSPSTSDDTSPTIPPFERHDVINKFLPYKGRRPPILPCTTPCFPNYETIAPPTEQAKPTFPPPIPKRNPRRPGHHSVSIPFLAAQEHPPPKVMPVRGLEDSEVAEENAFPQCKRPLESGQRIPTIPKPRPRSISDGVITPESERHTSTANSTLRFRELTTTQRQLTEQEKNAKWEDLLQRSDKAGGTLHVGSPIMGGLGLWSDRSSVALSVAPSETLDSVE